MNINNLLFFDKNGESYNFSQNAAGHWEGADYFLPVSTALFDCSNLFIVESTNGSYKFPKMDPGSSFEISWITPDSKDNFFLFTVHREDPHSQSSIYIDRKESLTINYSDFGQSIAQLNLSYPLQLNVAFTPSQEKAYSRVMQMYYVHNGTRTLVLELTFYGEGEDEDERFGVWLKNFGVKFNREDALILKDYDLKESLVDWKQVNYARKNLLVNRDQVYPYIGTYKGLLNIIDLMGYRDVLRVKEYWRDTDTKSSYYNKFAMVDVTDMMQIGDGSTLNLVDEHGQIKKGGKFRKTEFIALAYEFTVASDLYDDDGLPEVVSTTDFSVNEIFYKLHKFADKLKNEILPINVIIKDIIGEFIYFEKFNIRDWPDLTMVEALQINDTYKITVRQPDLVSLPLKIRDIKNLYAKINGISAFPALTFNPGPDDPFQYGQQYTDAGIISLDQAIKDYYEEIKYWEFYHPGETTPLDNGDDTSNKIGCPVVLEAYITDLTLQDLDGVTFGDFILSSPTTSSTSNDLTLGTKTFSCVTVQDFKVGDLLKIYVTANHLNYLYGTVLSISPSTNEIVVEITEKNGIGTGITGWNISIIDTHFTIGNIRYKNAYEAEWEITGPNNYQFQWRGKLPTIAKLPHILPYTGTYTVLVKVYDMQGGTSVDYQTITVQTELPVLQGFIKLQDKYNYTFKNLENITLGDIGPSPLFDVYANVLNANGETGALANISSHYLDWYTYSNRFGVGIPQNEIEIFTQGLGYVQYPQSTDSFKKYWGTGSANGQPTLADYENSILSELYHIDFSDTGLVGDTIDGFYIDLRVNDPAQNQTDSYILTIQFGGFKPIDIYTHTLTPSASDVLAILEATTEPGWVDFRYQLVGDRIKATAKYQQKKNHSIIKLVSIISGYDTINLVPYVPSYTNVTINNGLGGTGLAIGPVGTEYLLTSANYGEFTYVTWMTGDRLKIVNSIGQSVEGYITSLGADYLILKSTSIDLSTDTPSSPYYGIMHLFDIYSIDVIYTFNRPKLVFNTHTVAEIQTSLAQAGLALEEDLLFVRCPFVDKLKRTIYPFTPAKASNINYWIDLGFVVYDTVEGLQTGYLPSSYDENSFNMTNIKSTYDTLVVPTNHPVFIVIANLASNVQTEWTLHSGSIQIAQVKTPSYFIWRFEDPGEYQLHVKSIDARGNSFETETQISVAKILDPKEYHKYVEFHLNERKRQLVGHTQHPQF